MDLSVMKNLETEEIPKVIAKAALFGGTLVQPNLLTNLSTTITNIEVSHEGKLTIKLSEELSLQEDRPITVDLNYRDMFFRLKAGQYSSQGDTIVSELPKEARALPRRIYERYRPKVPITTDIRRAEKRDRSSDLVAQIADISLTGLGLQFGELRDGTLIGFDHIWIKEIHGMVLEKPLFGRVIYVSGPRVGIAFDALMPEDVFQTLEKLLDPLP
jgi:hypothetical protein